MAFLSNIGLLISLLCISLFHTSLAENKYSEEANKPQTIGLDIEKLHDLSVSYRMAAINLFARVLQADETELTKEQKCSLREILTGIVINCYVPKHLQETEDPKLLEARKAVKDARNYIKIVFNDSRLNELWDKDEMIDIANEELQTLKEGFQRYQDKMTEYQNLLKDVKDGDREIHENNLYHKPESSNKVIKEESFSNVFGTINSLKFREQRDELQAHIAQLVKLVAENPYSKEFIDREVQERWRRTVEYYFRPQELIKLKEKLYRLQANLLKLQYNYTEAALEAKRQRKGHEFKDMDPRMDPRFRKVVRIFQQIRADLEAEFNQGLSEL